MGTSDRSHLLTTLGQPRWRARGTGVSAFLQGILQATVAGPDFPVVHRPPGPRARMPRPSFGPCGVVDAQAGFSEAAARAAMAFDHRWGREPWLLGVTLGRGPARPGMKCVEEEFIDVCVDRASWMEVIHDPRITAPVDGFAVRFRPATASASVGARWEDGRPVYEPGMLDVHGTLKLAGTNDRERGARKRLLERIKQNAVKQVQVESIPPYGIVPVMGLTVYVDPNMTVVRPIPTEFEGYRVVIRPIGTPIEEFGESGITRMDYRPQPEDPCWYVGWDTMSPNYARLMTTWYGDRAIGVGRPTAAVGQILQPEPPSREGLALAVLAVGLGLTLIATGRTA
jgi:hypothetical protein